MEKKKNLVQMYYIRYEHSKHELMLLICVLLYTNISMVCVLAMGLGHYK